MGDVKWIKITTDIFDDEKILLIESLPSADSIITIWFKLLVLAGKQNNGGVFMLNERIAYTDAMLATILRRDIQTVKMALEVFERFEMIEILDGVITIPNWGKHQTLDTIESKRKYQREYMKQYRAAQKLPDCNTNSKTNDVNECKTNGNTNVSSLESDTESNTLLTSSYEEVCPTSQCDEEPKTIHPDIVEAWNALKTYGVRPITGIKPNGTRAKMLSARIREYGKDEVMRAIGKIKDSDFLLGKKRTGQYKNWQFDFDWFIRPNNFPSVLEGKYDNGGFSAPKTQPEFHNGQIYE